MYKNIILLLLSCSLFGCAALSPIKKPSKKWQQYQNGNLVQNPSFENKELDWQGPGCKLVNDTAHSGSNSLLMEAQRSRSSQCISRPFKIRPGHYDFSVWFKTHALNLSKERELRQALSIQLKLFDHEGNQISPYVNYRKGKINGHEYNYGIRDIYKDNLVDELGFSKITLVPRLYPYDAGWFDKKVAKVQIVLSFKGPGKIWVDDFNFSYSKWNFPLIERVQQLASKKQDLSIFPKPQELKIVEKPWQLDPDSDAALCIKGTHLKFHPAIERELARIDDKLAALGYRTSLTNSKCGAESFVLAIGLKNTPIEIKSYIQTELRSKEHYLIQPYTQKSGQAGLLLVGGGIQGEVYALQTLRQLIKRAQEGGIVLQRPYIYDFPTFSLRSTSGKDQRNREFRQDLKAATWLPESRLNTLFIEDDTHNLKWWQPRYQVLEALRKIDIESSYFEVIDLGIMLNPYIHHVDKSIEKEIVFSDPNTIEEIYTTIETFIDKGVSHIMLRADDFTPAKKENRFAYTLTNAKDFERFGSLARAHAHMINSVWKKMKKKNYQVKLSFVPPWYTNRFVELGEGLGESYLEELSALIPHDIPLYWCGPGVRSTFIDEIHVKRFDDWNHNDDLILWDNTLYARRHKVFWKYKVNRMHLNSYLEPYDVFWPKKLLNTSSTIPGVFINADLTELLRIQLATAGAYLWNPKAYQPEQALWDYLQMRFGIDAAKLLLQFDNLLWNLKKHKAKKKDAKGVSKQLLALLKKLNKELNESDGDLMDELRERYVRELF